MNKNYVNISGEIVKKPEVFNSPYYKDSSVTFLKVNVDNPITVVLFNELSLNNTFKVGDFVSVEGSLKIIPTLDHTYIHIEATKIEHEM